MSLHNIGTACKEPNNKPQTHKSTASGWQQTCSKARDRAHFGDVHDRLVGPHVSQAAQVGVLERLLGLRQAMPPIAAVLWVVVLQDLGQIGSLLPCNLHA